MEKGKGHRLRERKEVYGNVRATANIALVVAQLHAMPLPKGPFPLVTSASVIEMLREWAEFVGDRRLFSAVSRLRPLDDGEPVFLHGDLNARNILVDEDGEVSALIDWEDAVIVDFWFDVVTAYWFTLYGVPHAAGRFLKEYERSTGRLVEKLDGWFALLTLRGWAIAEVMRKQGQAIRLFETEAEKEEAERRLAIAGF